eukprot:g46565.t1
MDFEKQVKPAWLLYVESIDVDDVPDVPDVPEEEETPEPPMPKGSSKKKPGKPKSKKPAVDADEVDMSLESKAKGKWHAIHFLGNDYSSSNSSLPKTSPVFHRAFQSVNSLRNGNPLLLFTNVREQCHIQGKCKMETSRCIDKHWFTSTDMGIQKADSTE